MNLIFSFAYFKRVEVRPAALKDRRFKPYYFITIHPFLQF